jgi:hypothetical protein
MKAPSTLHLLSAGLFLASAALSQAAVQYNPQTRQTADEEEDIGVIAEAGAGSTDGKTYDGKSAKETLPPQKPSPFRLNVGARAQYTSNAELSGNHDSNDVIFFPSIEAGYHQGLASSPVSTRTGRTARSSATACRTRSISGPSRICRASSSARSHTGTTTSTARG